MSPSTLGAGPGLITTAVKRILGSLATWWMPRYCFTLGNARWPPCEFANHSSTNHPAVHLVINYIPKVSQSPYMSELRVWSPSPIGGTSTGGAFAGAAAAGGLRRLGLGSLESQWGNGKNRGKSEHWCWTVHGELTSHAISAASAVRASAMVSIGLGHLHHFLSKLR